MRYFPAALALSLAVAVTSSVGYGAEREADPRAAALIAEGRSELASGQVQAAIDSFEAALAQLEQIVQKLEDGRVPLAESIAIYERGEALKAHCETLLKTAEARIEKISLSREGKAVGTEPLDSN